MSRLYTGLVLVVALGMASSARGDEVTDWNAMMLRAAVIAGTSPLNMARVAAIVQASVFDAVNGLDHRYTPNPRDRLGGGRGPHAARRRSRAVYVAISRHCIRDRRPVCATGRKPTGRFGLQTPRGADRHCR